jgi:hypothetical protein
MSVRSYIVDDREKKAFLLDREVLVSEDVLRTEMARIFGRWIYVGHASELKKPGDFRSRKVNVARHGQGGRAAQQRRAPPAHLLAALERADGSAASAAAIPSASKSAACSSMPTSSAPSAL